MQEKKCFRGSITEFHGLNGNIKDKENDRNQQYKIHVVITLLIDRYRKKTEIQITVCMWKILNLLPIYQYIGIIHI